METLTPCFLTGVLLQLLACMSVRPIVTSNVINQMVIRVFVLFALWLLLWWCLG